ncbi:MAG: DUF4156 domain-containing protein [Wenzhouxiangella sp.]|nr:MAG: DUF4156 domain-containing protein [Wenzhouxiangella sp.]
MPNCLARPTLLLVLCLGASACTWVKPEPGAGHVAVKDSSQVTHCERLGQTTTSVRDRVAAVQRKPGRVEEELETLARNSALDLGGDTIVPDGPVRDGQRRFLVYRCHK